MNTRPQHVVIAALFSVLLLMLVCDASKAAKLPSGERECFAVLYALGSDPVRVPCNDTLPPAPQPSEVPAPVPTQEICPVNVTVTVVVIHRHIHKRHKKARQR